MGEINSNTTITKFAKQQLSTVVKSSDDLADAITKVENAYKKKKLPNHLKNLHLQIQKERKEAVDTESALLYLMNLLGGSIKDKSVSKAQDKQLEFIKEEITLINNLRKDYI